MKFEDREAVIRSLKRDLMNALDDGHNAREYDIRYRLVQLQEARDLDIELSGGIRNGDGEQ